MRDRHLPRLCHHCSAPLARQEEDCWRCGTVWPAESPPRVMALAPTTVEPRKEAA